MQDNVRHWLISNTRIIKTSIITLNDDCAKLRKCYFWIVVIDIFSNSQFSVKIDQYRLQYIWCVDNISLKRNNIIKSNPIMICCFQCNEIDHAKYYYTCFSCNEKWCFCSFVYVLRQCICGLRLLHILVRLNIHLHGFGHLMLYIYITTHVHTSVCKQWSHYTHHWRTHEM